MKRGWIGEMTTESTGGSRERLTQPTCIRQLIIVTLSISDPNLGEHWSILQLVLWFSFAHELQNIIKWHCRTHWHAHETHSNTCATNIKSFNKKTYLKTATTQMYTVDNHLSTNRRKEYGDTFLCWSLIPFVRFHAPNRIFHNTQTTGLIS